MGTGPKLSRQHLAHGGQPTSLYLAPSCRRSRLCVFGTSPAIGCAPSEHPAPQSVPIVHSQTAQDVPKAHIMARRVSNRTHLTRKHDTGTRPNCHTPTSLDLAPSFRQRRRPAEVPQIAAKAEGARLACGARRLERQPAVPQPVAGISQPTTETAGCSAQDSPERGGARLKGGDRRLKAKVGCYGEPIRFVNL